MYSAELPNLLTDGDGNPATGPEPTVVIVGDVQQLTITKQVSVVGGGPRITSYNVCYTKLCELATMFKTPRRIQAVNPPEVVMMVGVNGVGKTTTIGKLAHRAQMQGRKVLIAAGDTFRAAAIEQLEVWAKRSGADFFAKGAGSDPAAVAYEAIEKALAGGYDLLLLDTAGRLHTKINLMEELKKIKRVTGKRHEGSPHRTVLVVDATTGQNAIQQTKLFNEAVELDEIILTKLDGTAKGGIVVALASQFGVPITYVGLGEKMEDLRPFDGKDFASALLGV